MVTCALILWLEGIDPLRLEQVPAVEAIATHGADLHLVPSPLAEQSTCRYQTLTGMGNGSFGRFDGVRPGNYIAHTEAGIPEGAHGRLLPDMLRQQGLGAVCLEASDDTWSLLAGQTHDCAIVRLPEVGSRDIDTLDATINHYAELLHPAGHCIVLTDAWAPPPVTHLNINDFLADVGLLEVRGSRAAANVIWAETLAYGLGTGQVWVNMRGRESQGAVAPGREFQEVCDEVIRALRADWVDPQTNEPVVEAVLQKEEAYTGDYLFKAPDLTVVFRPGYAASPRATALDFDGISVRPTGGSPVGREGAPYARLVGSGPALASGCKTSARLIDVVPSLFYLLNQPMLSHFEGRAILPAFTRAYRDRTPVRSAQDSVAPLSMEDERVIVDRLRALGYLG